MFFFSENWDLLRSQGFIREGGSERGEEEGEGVPERIRMFDDIDRFFVYEQIFGCWLCCVPWDGVRSAKFLFSASNVSLEEECSIFAYIGTVTHNMKGGKL